MTCGNAGLGHPSSESSSVVWACLPAGQLSPVRRSALQAAAKGSRCEAGIPATHADRRRPIRLPLDARGYGRPVRLGATRPGARRPARHAGHRARPGRTGRDRRMGGPGLGPRARGRSAERARPVPAAASRGLRRAGRPCRSGPRCRRRASPIRCTRSCWSTGSPIPMPCRR